MASQPKQGEIWSVNYGNPSNKKDWLPSLVISVDDINEIGKSIIVLPIFPNHIAMPSRVTVDGAGTQVNGYAACDQIRSVEKSRLKKALGQVSHKTLVDCQSVLTRIIGLKPLPEPRGWGA